MLIPAAQWSDAELESFCRCLRGIDDAMRHGKKITRKLIHEISERNKDKAEGR